MLSVLTIGRHVFQLLDRQSFRVLKLPYDFIPICSEDFLIRNTFFLILLGHIAFQQPTNLNTEVNSSFLRRLVFCIFVKNDSPFFFFFLDGGLALALRNLQVLSPLRLSARKFHGRFPVFKIVQSSSNKIAFVPLRLGY